MRSRQRRMAGPGLAVLGLAVFGPVILAGCTSRPTPEPLKPARAAKVVVHAAGPYEVTARDLAASDVGWGAEQLTRLAVSHRGRPVPSWVVEKGGEPRLHFYAGPITDTASPSAEFTTEDVYWLEPSSGEIEQAAATPDVSRAVAGDAGVGGMADLGRAGGIDAAVGVEDVDALDAAVGVKGVEDVDAATGAGGSIEGAGSPGSVLVEDWEEHDLEYVPLRAADPWIWAPLTAPVTATYGLTLSHVLPLAAELEAQVWTNVRPAAAGGHGWQLRLAGEVVADASWGGIGSHVISATLAPGSLREGVNAVSLVSAGDSGAVDKVYLDRLIVRYRRAPVAEQGRLAWIADGQARVALDGFRAPLTVLDVSQPEAAIVVDAEALGRTSGARRFLAVGADGWLKPVGVRRATLEPDLRREQPAEYYVVGPPDLLAGVGPLVEYHRRQGLTVRVVDAAAAYDQFGNGVPAPEAIRDWLADDWRRSGGSQAATPGPARTGALPSRLRPRYVLLVGDASYDLRPGEAMAQTNRLPTFLVDTVFGGQTASDELFAELEQGQDPVLAVGRVPARNADQVKAWVAKTVAYLANGADSDGGGSESGDAEGAGAEGADAESTGRVLTVADPSERLFAEEARAFTDRLAPGTNATGKVVRFAARAVGADVDRADATGGTGRAGEGDGAVEPGGGGDGSGGGNEAARQSVAEALGTGPSLVAYFGHGSITQWGKDGLLGADALPGMRSASTGRLPVFFNFTCLTGLFTHPRVTSLAEALLFDPGGGAVAVLAPTSLTLPNDQRALSGELARTLATMPLGDQLLGAWRLVPADRPESRDVRRTFLLFGDPALTVVP